MISGFGRFLAQRFVGTLGVEFGKKTPEPELLSPHRCPRWTRGLLFQGLVHAFVEGIEALDAVQLTTMPPYRWRVLPTGEEVEIVEESEGKHNGA